MVSIENVNPSLVADRNEATRASEFNLKFEGTG